MIAFNGLSRRPLSPWGLGMGLVGVILFLVGAASHQAIPDSLEAKKFVLRDNERKIRAQMGVTDTGEVAINFHGKDGKKRIILSAKDDGLTAISLFDSAGRHRFYSGVTADGTTGWQIFDGNEKVRQQAIFSADGVSRQEVFDGQGTARSLLAVDDKGPSRLELRDRDGRIAGGNGPGGPKDEPNAADSTAKARVETAQKALHLLKLQIKEGKGDVNTVAVYQAWVARHIDSLVAAATTHEERVKALEYRLSHARQTEQSITDLFKRGEKTEVEVLDAKYLVLRAEAELAKAKAD